VNKSVLAFFLAVLFVFTFENATHAQTADEDMLFSKNDAGMMFGLPKEAWKQNVIAGKSQRVMDYVVTPENEYTMQMSTPMGSYEVTPHYGNKPNQPWKLTVLTVYSKEPFMSAMQAVPVARVEAIFMRTMKELQPEFSTVGHMNKKDKGSVEIHMSIFRKGQFPKIDAMNSQGQACAGKCLK